MLPLTRVRWLGAGSASLRRAELGGSLEEAVQLSAPWVRATPNWMRRSRYGSVKWPCVIGEVRLGFWPVALSLLLDAMHVLKMHCVRSIHWLRHEEMAVCSNRWSVALRKKSSRTARVWLSVAWGGHCMEPCRALCKLTYDLMEPCVSSSNVETSTI